MGNSITLDSQGRILVTGYSTNAAGNTDMAIWRYLPDGTLDTNLITGFGEIDPADPSKRKGFG